MREPGSVATTSAPRGPGRPPRSPEARAAQRALLLDAAMAAVRSTGADTSVDDMAAAAGVSKPVLYASFGDKHGIAEALAVELVDRSQQALLDELASGRAVDIPAAVRVAVDSFVRLIEAEPQLYAFIVRSIRTNDRGVLDNALVRSLQVRFEQYGPVLAPGADPALLTIVTHGTFGFMVGAVESWLVSRRPDRDQLVDQLVEVLLAAFATIAR
jgi:AcrR family transcriptional regulator